MGEALHPDSLALLRQYQAWLAQRNLLDYDDLVIKAPEEITLEAETRQTVQLTAEAASIGVHPVRLVATDVDGNPIGAFDEVDIRSNTVGVVIWVIMGVGIGILAISIPVRWARRRRQGRTA